MRARPRGVPAAVLAIVFLAGAIHALSFAFTFPPWAIEDEQQHVDYVWKLAHDQRLPSIDDHLDAAIITSTERSDRWGSYGLTPPGEATPEAMGLEARSYLAYHPPLGYLALTPVAWMAGTDATTVLYSLRVVMALVAGAVCVLTAMLAARWQGPGARQAAVALAAGVATAALPALAEAGGRVNMDILATAMVLAATLVILRWMDAPDIRRAWAVGLVVTAAFLTRETTVVLLVPLMVAVLVVNAHHGLRRAQLVRMVGPPAVGVAVWAVASRIVTGQFDGSQAFLDRYLGPAPAVVADRFANGVTANRVLLPFGGWSVPVVILLVVPVIVLIGLVLAVRAGHGLAVTVSVGMLVVQMLVLAVQVNRGLNVVSARLLLPSYPPAVAAATVGWAAVRRWTATFVPTGAAALLGLWFFFVDFVTRFPPRLG